MLLDQNIWVGTSRDGAVCLLPKMANRHGLISGATGTGKTVTLQVLAEGFSRLGVPVFLADVKGDLAGMSLPGIQTEDMAQRMMSGNITLDDFLSQMQSMKKMGGLQKVLNMLPGVRITQEVDDSALKVPEAIIRSMTMKERRNPGILNASRRRRIAAGSGTSVQQVNQLIRQFDQAKQMMKQMQGPGARRKLAAMMRNSK